MKNQQIFDLKKTNKKKQVYLIATFTYVKLFNSNLFLHTAVGTEA